MCWKSEGNPTHFPLNAQRAPTLYFPHYVFVYFEGLWLKVKLEGGRQLLYEACLEMSPPYPFLLPSSNNWDKCTDTFIGSRSHFTWALTRGPLIQLFNLWCMSNPVFFQSIQGAHHYDSRDTEQCVSNWKACTLVTRIRDTERKRKTQYEKSIKWLKSSILTGNGYFL